MHPQYRVRRIGPNLPDRVELIVGDVRDSSLWDDVLAKYRPSVVLHFAAETGTGQSLTEANRHASVNVVGTAQMLDAFTRAGVPDHIVLSSSRAVYGEGAWRNASGEVFYPLVRSHEQLERNEWDFVSEGRVATAPLPHRASEIFPNPSSIYGATELTRSMSSGRGPQR